MIKEIKKNHLYFFHSDKKNNAIHTYDSTNLDSFKLERQQVRRNHQIF